MNDYLKCVVWTLYNNIYFSFQELVFAHALPISLIAVMVRVFQKPGHVMVERTV